jgi:hypothetical protein
MNFRLRFSVQSLGLNRVGLLNHGCDAESLKNAFIRMTMTVWMLRRSKTRTKQSSRKRKPKCPVHSGTQGTNVAQTFAFFIRYICSSTSFCISRSQGHVVEKGKVVSKVVGMAAVDHSPPGSKNSIISTRKHLLHRQKVLSKSISHSHVQLPAHPPPPSHTRVKTSI